jgi:hypothetical protein
MAEPLEDLLRRLREDRELPEAGEEAICQGVVLPVFAGLGWDRDNIREVVPQYRVKDGRVDYCLKAGDRRVFVEVKQASERLEQHEEQLLSYAFHQGVDIAVLTSGLVWWLYLPLLKGSWDQRRFLAVDIQQQEIADAASHLTRYLSRGAVADGSALEQARALHESREKDRLIQETVPRAWEELCNGPDVQLVELIADKVEGLCGHRADSRAVQAFLADLARHREVPAPPQSVAPGQRTRRKTPRQLGPGVSQRDCQAVILRILLARGGSARSDEVLSRSEELLRPKLTAYDREVLESGEVRWRKRVQWERFRLTQQGLLGKGSPRGVWELTERGTEAARQLRAAR